MTVAQGLDAAPAGSDPAGPLSFKWLLLPADELPGSVDDPPLKRVLQGALADAECASDGQTELLVGARAARVTVLAPCQAQNYGLPVRFGEKVLFTFALPAIRLTPAAQHGVRSVADAQALLRWLRSAAPKSAVVLTDCVISSPLYAALDRAPSLGYGLTKPESDTHLFHRFGLSYQAFFDDRGSKYRNQLRKKEKVFLGRFGSDFELREYRRPDSVKAFLDAASSINRKTYQFRLFGESVDNDTDSLDAAQRAAHAGRFRSFVLWNGDYPLCFVLGHQRVDGTYEHRQTGYDPEWRDYSPGIYCNILLLQRLYTADRPLLLDFGSGDSDYKRLFSNESLTTANPVLIPNLRRYAMAVWLHRAAAQANTALVQLLARWGVKDQVKRWLRGSSKG